MADNVRKDEGGELPEDEMRRFDAEEEAMAADDDGMPWTPSPGDATDSRFVAGARERMEREGQARRAGANPWQGKLLGADDRELLKKGLRESSAYNGLRYIAIGFNVVAAIFFVLRMIALVTATGQSRSATGFFAGLAELLTVTLLLLAAGAVLRWLADFGDSRMEELADRLRERQ